MRYFTAGQKEHDRWYVFRSVVSARERAAGENNKFQIVLTQKVEICCRGNTARYQKLLALCSK
jgi:hypothetical protein